MLKSKIRQATTWNNYKSKTNYRNNYYRKRPPTSIPHTNLEKENEPCHLGNNNRKGRQITTILGIIQIYLSQNSGRLKREVLYVKNDKENKTENNNKTISNIKLTEVAHWNPSFAFKTPARLGPITYLKDKLMLGSEDDYLDLLKIIQRVHKLSVLNLK